MMLPGRATLRVERRGPEGWKTAEGLEVSTSLLMPLAVPLLSRFLLWINVRSFLADGEVLKLYLFWWHVCSRIQSLQISCFSQCM
jgi:hypothetical protein